MTNGALENPNNETPLNSWKEIAAYLQRDVSTAMRWEKCEGLPVRRHHHQARSSVYAYPSELEAWRANRIPSAEAPHSPWWRLVPAFASTMVIALALMTVGSGGHIGALVQAADGSGIVTRQMWSGAEVSSDVTVSPDRRYLAFVDNETWDLAVRDLTTGENRRLTNKKGGRENRREYAQFPVFSPDGKQVAFGWENPQDSCELRVVGMDGSGPRVLDPGEKHAVFPLDWSRDGKSILALLQTRSNGALARQVAVVSAADGSVRVLKRVDWRWRSWPPEAMRFSPDGQFVVYDLPVDEAGNRDVYVLSVANGQVTPLVQHPAQDRMLGWAPDGRSVLFLSDRTGSWGAWLVEVADGKPRGVPKLVKRDMGAIRPMGFVRDGSFYYGVRDPGANVYTATLGDGTPSLLVKRHLGANFRPAWSPDGKRIAYISVRSPGVSAPTLCIRSMETGNEQEYLPKLLGFGYPEWSPDGRSVLVSGADLQGRRGSFKFDLETRQVTPALVGEHGGYSIQPRWSADGKAIYYIEPRVEGTKRPARVMRRDLGTGRDEQVRVLPEGATWGQVFPSPDGRWLALMLSRADETWGYAVMPAGGAEIRELPGPWTDVKPWKLTWAPDSRQILFMRPVGRPGEVMRSELWGVPVQGGEQRSLGFSVPQDVGNLSIHPDGKQLAFHVGEGAAEVWVMENFLPPAGAAQ